jgi:RND family efflux transporter MFP subunit
MERHGIAQKINFEDFEMKRYLVPILTLVVGFVGGIWISGDEHVEHVEASATYICPMHPTVVFDKPGSCPICGMDLVLKDMEMSSMSLGKTATVQIDPVMVQNIGVKTLTIKKQPLLRTVRTVGRVDYDERRITDVNTKIAGWVEKLYVDYTGQTVRAGQRLLELYSPELVAAQEEYLIALDYERRVVEKAAAEVAKNARDLLDAARQRLLYWDISEAQIAELKNTRQVKRTMTVFASRSGIVTHKNVLEGAHIQSGEHLYRIADLSKVWVYADVYEYELPWIAKGQKVEVSLSYLPGRLFKGQVDYIFPYMEKKTRTVRVRMAFDNADGALKPDMFADVMIRPEVAREAVVVPTQAVIHSGTRRVVVLALGAGKFEPREIHLGVEAESGYEVKNGLEAGDRIVTSAQFLIDSESNLKAALAGMTGDDGAMSGHQH